MQSVPTICLQVGGFGFVSYERCTAFVLSMVEKAVTLMLDREYLMIVNSKASLRETAERLGPDCRCKH